MAKIQFGIWLLVFLVFIGIPMALAFDTFVIKAQQDPIALGIYLFLGGVLATVGEWSIRHHK